MATFLNSVFLFMAYILGAAIFLLDMIKSYENVAAANPDPKIKYVGFWHKERWNVIQIVLWGVVAVIIFPSMVGGSSVALHSKTGADIWSIPTKQALIPIMIIAGQSGGRLVMAAFSKTKKDLFKKVGIDSK